MGITQYTSFLDQQLEVMMNFRELIRLKKEKLGEPAEDGKATAEKASEEGSLEKATSDMEGLKLFEYFVEVQINAIEQGKSLTEEFKDKIEEMETRSKEEKAAKLKEETELRQAEKIKEKAQKAFERAKEKIEEENRKNGEALIELSDEELMEEAIAQEEAKAKPKEASKTKSKTTTKKEKPEQEEPDSLFDLFGEE